jgi:diguanylate cyclase (GGDEF)-like protein/PAS domain S-box-containing protein
MAKKLAHIYPMVVRNGKRHNSALLGSSHASLRFTARQLEQTVRAIRAGTVDALVFADKQKQWLYTRTSNDSAYRLLIEDMAEGALTVTPDGIIGYANRRFADLLGRPLCRVIGTHISSCFEESAHAALLGLLEAGKQGKRSLELELLKAQGTRIPAMLSVSPLLVNGVPGTICMVATDLTGHRRSEAAIQARQELLKALQEQQRTEESLRISMETLQLHDSALGAISQGVIITDTQSRVTYVNAAFEAITGYTLADMLGRTCTLLQGPGTSEATRAALHSAIAAGQPYHGEMLNYRKDGMPFWNEMSITPVFDGQGLLSQFVGVQRDITAHRRAEEELKLAAKVFKQSSEGIVIADAHNRIIKVNPAFSNITGYSESEVLGCNPGMLGSGCHDRAFFRAMWHTLRSCGRWQGDVWNRHKNGELYLVSLSLSQVSGAAGKPAQYIASFSDITERKRVEGELRRMAHFDLLTGLPNRALLGDRVTHALQEASRNHETVTMMFMDLDRFKNVNDSLGHRIGDRLLVAVATRIKGALREQDTVSRVGGDEFVLLLPATNADGAAHLAQELVGLLQMPFLIDEHELAIGSSIGIALYPGDGASFETLYKSADAAMYRTKQEGGNAFHFYTDELQRHSERVLLLENALRHALERDEMQLYYQPQRSFHDRKIIGAEALLRWRHPRLGMVPPTEFIPIAESSGMIHAIGEWVLRTAVRQMRQWIDSGMGPIIVAVNLSAMQFRQKTLLDQVGAILDESGIPANYLELELTESVAFSDPEGAIATMDKLNTRGVRMSIDDFGTGYSSLNYLKRFKATRLKIDRSFVRNITENAEDQAIVTAIISLANSLGMQTIAEGVENPAQMELLRQKGCDEMQGYWLSTPLPAAQFESFIEAASQH